MTLPVGYRIEKRSRTVSVDETCDILKTKKQFRRYTSAKRNNDNLTGELEWHQWCCPYCGKRVGAYNRSFGLLPQMEKTPANLVEEWATAQTSLFPAEHTVFRLQAPLASGPEYECPRCHKKSGPSKKERETEIFSVRHKIAVTLELGSIEDILAMKWLPSKDYSLSFPLSETVIFNFNNNHTYIKLHDGGRNFAVCDITRQPQKWASGDPLYDAICNYTCLGRMLRAFTENLCGGLPFAKCELTPGKYVLMTRFSGFDREFYDTIPFTGGSDEIDSSFASVASHLGTVKEALRFFENSSLPQSKSIRKIILKNPGILFYLHECETLWSILNDVNLLRFLMERRCFIDVLVQLHLYPGVVTFYRDYAEVKSKRALVARLTQGPAQTNFEGVVYSSLNDDQKLEERKKWKKKAVQAFFAVSSLPMPAVYSVPMNHRIDPEIFPCKIDGFSFVWLRTSNDYYKTGEALKNCLKDWREKDNPVIAVMRDERPVAALEIKDKCIVQARLRRNESLDHDPRLKKAVERWRRKFHMEEIERESEDEAAYDMFF